MLSTQDQQPIRLVFVTAPRQRYDQFSIVSGTYSRFIFVNLVSATAMQHHADQSALETTSCGRVSLMRDAQVSSFIVRDKASMHETSPSGKSAPLKKLDLLDHKVFALHLSNSKSEDAKW